MESRLTLRSFLAGMIPPRTEALRLLKVWASIFAFLALTTALRSWDRGVGIEAPYLALLATEAALFTAILDLAALSSRDHT